MNLTEMIISRMMEKKAAAPLDTYKPNNSVRKPLPSLISRQHPEIGENEPNPIFPSNPYEQKLSALENRGTLKNKLYKDRTTIQTSRPASSPTPAAPLQNNNKNVNQPFNSITRKLINQELGRQAYVPPVGTYNLLKNKLPKPIPSNFDKLIKDKKHEMNVIGNPNLPEKPLVLPRTI
jgi:hypothetical protein